MASIEKFDILTGKLAQMRNTASKSNVSVLVGFTAAYALAVHENEGQVLKGLPRPSGLGEYWGPDGQPKFLEQPARELASEISAIIVNALKSGLTMLQALLMGGFRLQREAQLHVPIEYGNLRASAFTRQE